MNIFILDKDPVMIAKYHTDRHVVRMIYESAVMLSLTWQFSNNEDIDNPKTGYKSPRHFNHPCTQWVREDVNNYNFLLEIAENLNNEWNNRFHKSNPKIHKSLELIRTFKDSKFLNIPNQNLTNFKMATMWVPRIKQDPVSVYREYYIQCKQHLARWYYNLNILNPIKPSWYIMKKNLHNSKFEFIDKYIDPRYTKEDFYNQWRLNHNRQYKDVTLDQFYQRY